MLSPAAPRNGCSALNVAICTSVLNADVEIRTVDADVWVNDRSGVGALRSPSPIVITVEAKPGGRRPTGPVADDDRRHELRWMPAVYHCDQRLLQLTSTWRACRCRSRSARRPPPRAPAAGRRRACRCEERSGWPDPGRSVTSGEGHHAGWCRPARRWSRPATRATRRPTVARASHRTGVAAGPTVTPRDPDDLAAG